MLRGRTYIAVAGLVVICIAALAVYVMRAPPAAQKNVVVSQTTTTPLLKAPAQASQNQVTLLLFGDSLTAGYGVARADGFPAILEFTLKDQGYDVEIINGGVSGDTTAAALARLDWSLTPQIDAVVVELGANDALRGMDPAHTEENLSAILDKIKARDLPVLLAGMKAPPNLGPQYEKKFNDIFVRLAQEENIALYPFFLEGVAAQARLNQDDGIHPNKEGVQIIVEGILPDIKKLIEQAAPSKAGAPTQN